MAVENQENGVRKAPLIFIVPAWGFVVAARTKPFQLHRSTSEQIRCPSAQRMVADPTRGINPEQSLRELRRQTGSLKPGRDDKLCSAERREPRSKAPIIKLLWIN
jgi:hypothetical protein